MQSGKTTTSLALQFAGPIVYLLTGRCLYPIYLITSHTSQEDQTKIELRQFLEFYGELSVKVDDQHQCTLIEYARTALIDPAFEYSPTINTYREHVLKGALTDILIGPRLEDFVQRRSLGESLNRIVDLCKRADAKGFVPLLIIDEPQFGASDRFRSSDDGELERRPCVLIRLFNRIDEALGKSSRDRVFIGLSATPYELNHLSAVWKVHQYLSSNYVGFNYFWGKVIDAGAQVRPPRTMSFAGLGQELRLPFLDRVSLAAYDNKARAFKRFARDMGYVGTHAQYQYEVERTLRNTILRLAAAGSTPRTGICVRLFNDNSRSQQLLERLDLPAEKIEVLKYFGSEQRGNSVKRIMQNRERPDLPFVIAVTNRARMGDAFPREVEWFLEFARKAADLNALLQGLLGRACGYNKRSTVIMSEDNCDLVENYKQKWGAFAYRTSRHSLIVGRRGRGVPTALLHVRRDMDDPLVRTFFRRIDREIVDAHIIQGGPTVRARRAGKKGYRTGPLLRIAEEIGLFEYLEKSDIRCKLFPTFPPFRIARAGDEVPHSSAPNGILRYSLDTSGNCRFTFREWTNDGSNHGGIRSRGYGGRDASDRTQSGDTLEPQISLKKYDLETGGWIDDRGANGKGGVQRERKPGNWRAETVTLPLVAAVRESRMGHATYPVEHSPFSDLMSMEEREEAGYHRARTTDGRPPGR